jgi:nucleoside-diphosphate-sugar epimerase
VELCPSDFLRPTALPLTPTSHLRSPKPALLIVGCGDVGLRVLRLLRGPWRVWALTSSPERAPLLRAAGAWPLLGNLDDAASLGRLAAVARTVDAVLHLAPPPGQGRHDPRTAHLLAALGRASRLQALVYASTTGVYGDQGGRPTVETTPVAPSTDRAWRRVDAEARVRAFGHQHGVRTAILRIPGIYALDRDGGDPCERVRRGSPALRAEDDVYTNHIHADDLARACVAALQRARPGRVFNVVDDTDLPMGEHLDLVARIAGLPPVPRLSRAEAAQQLSAMAYSFMSESRRIGNQRLKAELRLRLRHPTVADALRGARSSAPA